jgi:HAD superfamily hydrolase (TIGR01490 family)
MDIALFDLDHTLIPFDSGAAFTRYLIGLGALEPDFEARYLEQCRRYVQGTVDMADMHRLVVGALGRHPPDVLARWLGEFSAEIRARVPQVARALVQEHRHRGHLCALVTATTRFIAEPFGTALGLPQVLATEPEVNEEGRYTGEIVGEPCFREHKLTHVQAWLAQRGVAWCDIQRSWFYSDSYNDLPLMEAVTDPVAVSPDPRLRAHALARGWPVRELNDGVAR